MADTAQSHLPDSATSATGEPELSAAVKPPAGRRVLHLDLGREMRGGQHQVLALMEGLRDLGVEQQLLTRAGSPLAIAALARRFPVGDGGWRAVAAGSRWADLVHAHCAASHTRAALMASAPLVVSRRVAFPVGQDALSRWKYGRAHRYIAVSRHVFSLLLQAGIPRERLRVVHDGVPLLPPPDERRDIVALSSNDPGKCNRLIQAAADLGHFPVVFARDLPAAFRHARLFVYLSTGEGLGSATLLALSASIPVIATRLPALAEVVDDGVCGLLVDNDPAELATAVHRLLASDSGAAAMGVRGRQRVESAFTNLRMVRQTLAVYEELW